MEELNQKEEFDYKALFTSLTDSTNDGFWVWFVNEDYEYLSPRFKEILGYKDDEMENKPSSWQKLMHPEDIKKIFDAVQKCFDTGVPFIQEGRYNHRKGHTVYVICRGNVIKRDKDGNPLIVAGTHTDITDIKVAQENLQREKNKLVNLNTNKSDYIARLNHEIRTPLNVILSYAQLLQMSTEMNQEDTRYTDHIYKSGTHMLRVVNDVIDISRLEMTNQIEIYPEFTDIKGLILEQIELQSIIAKHFQVTVDTEFPNKEISIHIDPKRMKQIIMNLLSNALKYNVKGGNVTVKLEQTLKHTIISVVDTGIGISKDNLKRLYVPFQTFQTASSENKYMESSGIGLALVKQLCNKMNIDIQVNSTPHKGSTFTLLIPLISIQND